MECQLHDAPSQERMECQLHACQGLLQPSGVEQVLASKADWLQCVSANASHFEKLYALIFLLVLVYTMVVPMWLAVFAKGGVFFIVSDSETVQSNTSASPGTSSRNVVIFQCLSRPLSSLSAYWLCCGAIRTAHDGRAHRVWEGGMLTVLVYATVVFACVTMPHMSFHEPARFDALDALELQTLSKGP
eukprot:scaffold5107_cov51-Phaeocystis_antarctica.AAC.3